ncbi:hypothetical protein EBH_0052330 [Eimeria brunetti]|uniref:Uncharacterized protein n=1 Tax=Eimeria brunetti TaxID=51314 RepID=U6LRI0_9EIME|nr:hypothetical protein EBH_0052330 [Eimeria brunetti]
MNASVCAGVKVALIRQVAEMGDAFDLLRKWLTCSEHKIRFYEQGYKWSSQQEEEELDKIEELQRAIRVAEAAARSSYISHRAFLLGQQLKAGAISPSQKEVYAFLKCTLDRFGWLFGETEPSHPKSEENIEDSFGRLTGDEIAVGVRREVMYPFGAGLLGAQGTPPTGKILKHLLSAISVGPLPLPVSLMLFPMSPFLVPVLSLWLSTTVDKLVECRTRLRDLKMQCALNQASADWRFFNINAPTAPAEGAERANEKGDAS